MKKQILIWIFLLSLKSSLVLAKSTLTLMESYQQSIKHSQTLASDDQNILIAEAHYQQALAGILPHLKAGAVQTFQDTNTGSSTIPDLSSTKVALTVEQPLFQGLREFKAMKMAKLEKSQNQIWVEQAKHDLFADVAKAYYSVLASENAYRLQHAITEAFQDRVTRQQERVQVGKSKQSDLFTTQSDLLASKANEEQDKAQIQIAREYLGFLTGQAVTESLIDEFPVPSNLPKLTTWLELKSDRADLKASEQSSKLAQAEVAYKKSLALPTLNLVGNYYPYRSGYQENVAWDVNLNLSVPLYSGGLAKGTVNESKAKYVKAKLSESSLQDQAQLEIQQAYSNVVQSQAMHKFLSESETFAKKSYDKLSQDYEFNLVNHLDVLDALKSLENRRLSTSQSYYQTKLYYLQLLVYSGKIAKSE